MGGIVEDLVREGTIIPVGDRRLTRAGVSVERYKIWLPETMNTLWRRLWEERRKVEVYFVVKQKKQ